MTQATQEASARPPARTPVGTIHVVDPHALNWLYITWNTMEEPVRTDTKGHLIGAAMEDSRWIDDTTLEVRMRRGVRFQDGEACTAHSFKRAFDEVQRWKAPHPPGTSLNFHPATRLELLDDYTLRLHFPEPDGWSWANSAASTSPAAASGTSWALATGTSAPAKATGE